jgi:hypothetical protein
MGGSAILDYAIHDAASPPSYIRLGYASFLSAWALMNTGTPESDYGYWYPGKENDGGAAGGFEPAPMGRTWLGQPHHRGAWYYSSEIDLGYCGALRMAATVLADDPLFGRHCFGGDWRRESSEIFVVPRDGVRRRFYAWLGGRWLRLRLSSDRFDALQPIRLAEDFSQVRFQLENASGSTHTAMLRIAGLARGLYGVATETEIASFRIHGEEEVVVALPMLAGNAVNYFGIERRVPMSERVP